MADTAGLCHSHNFTTPTANTPQLKHQLGQVTAGFRFIRQSIAPGSVVRTDGWHAYMGLDGYVHDRQVQMHQPEEEHLLPRAHRVTSLLKRWLLGTHQGAVGPEHLDD